MQIDPQPRPEPAERAVADLGDGLELRADGVARRGARVARASDVPVRLDLPMGHPLRGQRALRVVPAGMGDCTLDDEGRLVPIGAAPAKPVEAELERIR